MYPAGHTDTRRRSSTFSHIEPETFPDNVLPLHTAPIGQSMQLFKSFGSKTAFHEMKNLN